MSLVRKIIYTLFYLPLLFLVSTCQNGTHKEDKRTVFNYNEMAGITSLDPASANNLEDIWAVHQLFNGLVQMNDSLRVIPSIAKTWAISNDGLTYTFNLRNDVLFTDNACFDKGKGRPVTAKDFVYSFNRLYDSRVSSAVSFLSNVDRTEKTNYKGFYAANDTTFK